MARIQDVDIPYLEFAEGAAPGTPASGITRIYAKTDGSLYQKDDAGTETNLAASATAPNLAYGRYLQTGANITLTGTTAFTALNSTADTYKFTRTTGAHPVVGGCHLSVFVNNAAGEVSFDVAVDGTRLGSPGTFGIVYAAQHATASEAMVMSFGWSTPVLSAGSHTFELQWRIGNSAHTATLFGQSGGVTSGWWMAELYAA